jgi:hypothetical protein
MKVSSGFSSLRGAMGVGSSSGATVGTRVVPGQSGQPVSQPAVPVEPAPPASEVPSPAATAFAKPVPTLKSMIGVTPKDLKSVSEAIADASVQNNTSVASTPRPKTLGQQDKDLKSVSESINDSAEESDTDGED